MKLTDFKFISKREAAALLGGISPTTLNRYRKDPEKGWEENVHYTMRDSGEWEYNEILLTAWYNRKLDPHGYINALQTLQQAKEASHKRKKKANPAASAAP